MGTRCSAYFTDTVGAPPAAKAAANKLVEANIFRHWDGYPEVAGVDLLKFLETEGAATEGSRVGDCSMLAARYVAFLANSFNVGNREVRNWTGSDLQIEPAPGMTNPCDFLSVRIDVPTMGAASDVEYEYWIDGAGSTYVREACYGWGSYPTKHGKWRVLSDVLAEIEAEKAVTA